MSDEWDWRDCSNESTPDIVIMAKGYRISGPPPNNSMPERYLLSDRDDNWHTLSSLKNAKSRAKILEDIYIAQGPKSKPLTGKEIEGLRDILGKALSNDTQ